jgi:hypothetical protein
MKTPVRPTLSRNGERAVIETFGSKKNEGEETFSPPSALTVDC